MRTARVDVGPKSIVGVFSGIESVGVCVDIESGVTTLVIELLIIVVLDIVISGRSTEDVIPSPVHPTKTTRMINKTRNQLRTIPPISSYS
jgi:hypothetical protein